LLGPVWKGRVCYGLFGYRWRDRFF
jgi:hypothetical protein